MRQSTVRNGSLLTIVDINVKPEGVRCQVPTYWKLEGLRTTATCYLLLIASYCYILFLFLQHLLWLSLGRSSRGHKLNLVLPSPHGYSPFFNHQSTQSLTQTPSTLLQPSFFFTQQLPTFTFSSFTF
jgi:hypothetical protein